MTEADRTDVATIVARFPGPVRLYGDKKFLRYVLGVFAVIEFVLVKGLFTGDGTHRVATLIFIALFLWGLGMTAYIMLNRNALAMDLDRDGFTINRYLWYSPLRRAWSDIGELGTKSTRGIGSATYKDLQNGRQQSFPDTYGLGSDGLVALMSQWRRRALGS